MELVRLRQRLVLPLAYLLAAAVGCGGGMEPSDDSGIERIDGAIDPMGGWPGPILIQAAENCLLEHSVVIGGSMIITCYQPANHRMEVDAVNLGDYTVEHSGFDVVSDALVPGVGAEWIHPEVFATKDGDGNIIELTRLGADGGVLWRWRAAEPSFPFLRGVVEWDGSLYGLLHLRASVSEPRPRVYLGRWTPSPAGVVSFEMTRVDSPDDCLRPELAGVQLTTRGSALIMSECALGVLREVNMDGPVRTCRIPSLTFLSAVGLRTDVYSPGFDLMVGGNVGPSGSLSDFYLAEDCTTRPVPLPQGHLLFADVSRGRWIVDDGYERRTVSIRNAEGTVLAQTPLLPQGNPTFSLRWASSDGITYVVGSSVLGNERAFTIPYFFLRYDSTEGPRAVVPLAISSHPANPQIRNWVSAVAVDDEGAALVLTRQYDDRGTPIGSFAISRILPSGEEDLGPPERN